MFYFLGENMDNLLYIIEEDYAKFYGNEYIFDYLDIEKPKKVINSCSIDGSGKC